MFVYNFKEWKMPNISVFKKNIDTELLMLENQLKIQMENKDKIYQNFINLSIETYLNLTDVTVLSDFNNAFSISNEIISKLKKLYDCLIALNKFVQEYNYDEKTFDSKIYLLELQEKLEDYYNNKNEIQPQILNLETDIKSCMDKLLKYDKSVIASPKVSNEPKTNSNNIKSSSKTQKTKPAKISKKDKKTQSHDNRVLIISEKENKVYLPYYISDIEKDLENNSDKYNSIQDVIEDKYIESLSKYKSTIISRFKEAFKLIKEKENGSFVDAFSLGLELMNNYQIHPAIIAACKSEEELDSYLYYLEENQLDLFECFDIKFEIPPANYKS